MEREELAGWLRLASTPGVGRTTARRLLANFGLPDQLFAQGAAAYGTAIPFHLVEALLAEPPGWSAQVERTWAWLCGGTDRRLLTLADSAYPPALLQTEDPPLLLYAQGQLPTDWPTAVAVVGSRNPTPQGLINAREFSRVFALAGLTVVSGLALGIDGAAHEGALDGAPAGQLATIAVVGTGLDRVYPSRHLDLAHRIAQRGLLLSEYPLGTSPLPENFPQRNRILSALAQGTLVVEAALRSGSLITARLALEQGKDVFAVPGSIHAPQSRGCHALLKQGAKLVETAQDVLEDLAPQTVRPVAAAIGSIPVPPFSQALLKALGYDPTGLDALVARTGIAPSTLQAQLLELELSGQVMRLPGGLFQRIASA